MGPEGAQRPWIAEEEKETRAEQTAPATEAWTSPARTPRWQRHDSYASRGEKNVRSAAGIRGALLRPLEDCRDLKKVLGVAVLAWNAALYPGPEREKLLREMVAMVPPDAAQILGHSLRR